MPKPFFLKKMQHSSESSSGSRLLNYTLVDLPLNPLLGRKVTLAHTGKKQCVFCSRSIKKTFGGGYCFPCNQRLARCDLCIVRPERCHYHQGTCREPEWGKENCLIPHLVYLANTTGVKVGITRFHKRLERWGDQGAVQALPLVLVRERYHAGLVEQQIATQLNDKTDWRALITGKRTDVNLQDLAAELRPSLPAELCEELPAELQNVEFEFEYPVLHYPEKAKVLNFDKQSEISGEFHGIKGQYLFIGGAALNIRKFAGYEIEFSSQ